MAEDYSVYKTIRGYFRDSATPVDVDIIKYGAGSAGFDISNVANPLYVNFPTTETRTLVLSLAPNNTYPPTNNYLELTWQQKQKASIVIYRDGVIDTQTTSSKIRWLQPVFDTQNLNIFTRAMQNNYTGRGFALTEDYGITELYSFGPAAFVTQIYQTSPERGYIMRRGESVDLVFTEKYSDNHTVSPVDFTVTSVQPDEYGITNWTISGNTLTITDECWNRTVFVNVASVTNPNITGFAAVTVINANRPPASSNPYLPSGGGISGGGNQSGISTVIGSFDGQPGPAIKENLPAGASASDVASSGMYTKYLCNNSLLNLLSQFFWEDNIGIQALKAVLGNPIDSIISLAAYPFALDTLVPKTATTIYFGQYDSHFSAFSLTKSSFQIDWGTVTIPFFWGSFLDYSPYTKIQLYLPWGVGFVSIDPNEVVPWSSKNSYNKADFVNGTIQVVTNIELDKGACVHNIIGNNGRIIGSFGGVVGKQIPVTGSDNSARILSMMSAAISSSAAVGMSAGGAVAAGKNLAYGKGMTMAERAEGREMIGNYKSSVGGAIQSLSGGIASPPSYPRAGTFSDATNTLGYQYPYLIISRPSQSVPQQYGKFMGYPSNIFHDHLGEVRGYTEVSSIHLENINATANELDELESILKGGVLL